MIPIIDHSMSNRIVYSISGRPRVGQRLVTDEEIQIFNTTLGRKIAWLAWYCRRTRRLSGRATGGDGSRKHTEL
jgi:hypothetical protein